MSAWLRKLVERLDDGAARQDGLDMNLPLLGRDAAYTKSTTRLRGRGIPAGGYEGKVGEENRAQSCLLRATLFMRDAIAIVWPLWVHGRPPGCGNSARAARTRAGGLETRHRGAVLSLAVRPRGHRRVIWEEERARGRARIDLMGAQEQNADRSRGRTGPRSEEALMSRLEMSGVHENAIGDRHKATVNLDVVDMEPGGALPCRKIIRRRHDVHRRSGGVPGVLAEGSSHKRRDAIYPRTSRTFQPTTVGRAWSNVRAPPDWRRGLWERPCAVMRRTIELASSDTQISDNHHEDELRECVVQEGRCGLHAQQLALEYITVPERRQGDRGSDGLAGCRQSASGSVRVRDGMRWWRRTPGGSQCQDTDGHEARRKTPSQTERPLRQGGRTLINRVPA
ncbi:hypothetical protein L227DRAFT_603122 [Lentinus tigrinus ALCF2SS1-6]|uniref:Uncharacterized protein n=1 Tax=Lentinus tigrinus ALCF2SS1-6 TaxID=1328759 RepID=A0A5C2RYZ9_9APHY|nr:hypothetical protein L227DRAFT_603122 [Lentinus tigrinus ALCF2SS1-6]